MKHLTSLLLVVVASCLVFAGVYVVERAKSDDVSVGADADTGVVAQGETEAGNRESDTGSVQEFLGSALQSGSGQSFTFTYTDEATNEEKEVTLFIPGLHSPLIKAEGFRDVIINGKVLDKGEKWRSVYPDNLRDERWASSDIFENSYVLEISLLSKEEAKEAVVALMNYCMPLLKRMSEGVCLAQDCESGGEEFDLCRGGMMDRGFFDNEMDSVYFNDIYDAWKNSSSFEKGTDWQKREFLKGNEMDFLVSEISVDGGELRTQEYYTFIGSTRIKISITGRILREPISVLQEESAGRYILNSEMKPYFPDILNIEVVE